jgi:hypothetical protein
MKAGTFALAVTTVAVLSAVAIKAILERPGRAEQAQQAPANSTSAALSRVQQPRTAALTANSSNAIGKVSNSVFQNGGTNTSTAAPAKEPLRDPIARVALTLVGADSDAEDYWFAAINDLTLPANERQDLIEDLNEEGLSDPEHPTIEDLPLIFNRLALIETIGPDAADEVNAKAFVEAYNDLLNLADLAMGGGEPIR